MEAELDIDGNYKIKVILIGQSGVGKTNLINIAQNKSFEADTISTPTCSFFKKEMIVENKKFNIYLWDTIGQERLKAQTKLFFKNSKIVILVYDISSKESYNALKFWYEQVIETLGNNIILGVLGNKIDLYLKEEVKEEEATEYAESIGAKFALVSAKTQRLKFMEYLEDLIKIYIKEAINKNGRKKSEKSVKLDKEKNNKKKCC